MLARIYPRAAFERFYRLSRKLAVAVIAPHGKVYVSVVCGISMALLDEALYERDYLVHVLRRARRNRRLFDIERLCVLIVFGDVLLGHVPY